MKQRLLGTLGVIALGAPLLSMASEAMRVPDDRHAPLRVAAKADDPPLSREDLFADTDDAAKTEKLPAADKTAPPESRDALFALDPPAVGKEEPVLPASKDALFGDAEDKASTTTLGAGQARPSSVGVDGKLNGFLQTELAYNTASPAHWSKVQGRLELGTQGRLSQGARWKVSGRVDYNAVYDLTDDYQSRVRDDQRLDFQVRETYLDISGGDWDWRLGRQHIVWGEMVGIFVADVVSAKDLREFILPDFQILRIPQWAARAEYFKDDFHAELIWIPFASYDEVGTAKDPLKPGLGSDFYPYPPAFSPTIRSDKTPSNSLSNMNYGLRLNQIKNGWDLSAFYYNSMNSAATWYQTAPNVFTPKHDRIWQAGGTLAKDLGHFVLKAEAVYSNGRRFNLLVPDPDGVVKQDTLDWAVGLDFNPSTDTRINTQFYQRYFFDHNPNIIPDKAENGVTLLVNHRFSGSWSAEALLVHSLNRSDWMFRPKAMWGFQPNWKLSFGLDVFGGPATGLFGQFDDKDRAYAEVRYDF